MRYLAYIAFGAFVLAGCGVSFQSGPLYDAYEEPPASQQMDAVIFEDAVGTMWNSLADCGDFEVVHDRVHSGSSAIRLSWNKGNCEWIGFGNSFSNWTPTDMSQIRHNLALTFYVRSTDKPVNAIPIVACMEDAGGGGSYHFMDASKYLVGLTIDSTWKQMIVPLWDFPIIEEEVDISAIRQMQFQLEGSGSFYLDDIRLIPYSKEEYAAMREEVEGMKPNGSPQQTIYRPEHFKEDAWGTANTDCHQLQQINSNGSAQIKWTINEPVCDWAKWGINWNGWYAVNMRGADASSQLSFEFKSVKGASFSVYLEDFAGHSCEVMSIDGTSQTGVEWQHIEIPLSTLPLKEKGIALDRVKQLYFVGEQAGEVWIRTIKLKQL
ncbi:MAG: hypothetical protein KDC12_00830 [Flavobacteriales bacterium]|nr:hypothetical protein [Flavobacteriales bacterium]